MTDALYERYKDALRRGHVAALRGRHDVALDAYREASQLAPDRALPFVGIGGVLSRVGRDADALAAYDAALDRSPADEAALRGRADLLEQHGDRAAAAATLDRLASALESAGRLPEATDAARRALELAESRGRRTVVGQLVDRLRGTADDGAAAARASATALLERIALGAPASGVDPMADAAPVAEAPPPPPFLGGEATARLESAVDGGDPAAILVAAMEAAHGHRAAGAPAAAIDACYLALASNPAAPDLHLTLADLYLDRGWRSMAADKLGLLGRLADLEDDDAVRARIHAMVAARLPDEARPSVTDG